jgi:hypothetical protein
MAVTQKDLKFGLSWKEGEDIVFETALPPEDDIAAFLLRMRPFVLAKERTNFHKVRNVLARYLTLPSARDYLDRLRDLYAGKFIPMRIEIRNVSVTSDEAIDAWLNASEYHQDEDKEAELRVLYDSFSEESARVWFLTTMLHRASAIGKMGALIANLKERAGSTSPLHVKLPRKVSAS